MLSLYYATLFFGVMLVGVETTSAVTLTAEVYETPGLDGYYTYDITATIDNGFLNTFDFYDERGITGAIFQESSPVGGGVFTTSQSDSGFLVDPAAGLSLFPSESQNSLNGVYAIVGDVSGHQTRSWTFARVVTDSPAEVRLNGALAFFEAYSDGTSENFPVELYFDTYLSDVTIGEAPTLGDLPAPPPPVTPVLPPPAITLPPLVTPSVVVTSLPFVVTPTDADNSDQEIDQPTLEETHEQLRSTDWPIAVSAVDDLMEIENVIDYSQIWGLGVEFLDTNDYRTIDSLNFYVSESPIAEFFDVRSFLDSGDFQALSFTNSASLFDSLSRDVVTDTSLDFTTSSAYRGGSTAVTASVPEPTALLTLLSACTVGLLFRRDA